MSSLISSLETFVLTQFPSFASNDNIERRNKFDEFIKSIFPTDLSANYKFVNVKGDGSCFFHTILRFFGLIALDDIPNKDIDEFDENEKLTYVIALSSLRESATEYIRHHTGNENFVLEQNIPEYQMIAKFIADIMDLRIIVVEYNAYEYRELNKVYQFTPAKYNDSIILINVNNHFTLFFPTSSNPQYDTKKIREIVSNELLSNACFNDRLASIDNGL